MKQGATLVLGGIAPRQSGRAGEVGQAAEKRSEIRRTDRGVVRDPR